MARRRPVDSPEPAPPVRHHAYIAFVATILGPLGGFLALVLLARLLTGSLGWAIVIAVLVRIIWVHGHKAHAETLAAREQERTEQPALPE